MAGDDETRRGTVQPGEGGGTPRQCPPCGEHKEGAVRRPDGIGEITRKEAHPVPFRLVPLRDGAGDTAVDFEQFLQNAARRRGSAGALGGNLPPRLGRVAAPWHDVIKQDVAVRHVDFALRELQVVMAADIRVVVAGDQNRRRVDFPDETFDFRAAVERSPAISTKPGVEGVAVEYDLAGVGQQRPQAFQVAKAAGVLAVMQVGKDSGDDAAHSVGWPGGSIRGAGLSMRIAAERWLVPAWVIRKLSAMPLALFLWLALTLPLALRADRVAEIVEIHRAVVGGRERLESLSSFRAEGHVLAASGAQVRFTMVAARPNLIRLETEKGGRKLVQGWDGRGAPWELDTASWPPRYRDMPAGAARTFMTDAEFDDPLLAGAGRGFTLEFAGDFEAEGRRMLRVLVTRRLVDTFSLIVDEETCLIHMRVEQRQSAGGRAIRVATQYTDYRPVEGVLMPHTITLSIDGKATQQTKIARIVANSEKDGSLFRRPDPEAAAASASGSKSTDASEPVGADKR